MKTHIYTKTCTGIFTTALFTIDKWKQPKCTSTDEWINKMWYMNNGILFRDKKK